MSFHSILYWYHIILASYHIAVTSNWKVWFISDCIISQTASRRHFASHPITSHHIVMTSHHHDITSSHIVSHIISPHMTSYHMTLHMTLYHLTSYDIISYDITYHIISPIWHHIIWHYISYYLISYHIISCSHVTAPHLLSVSRFTCHWAELKKDQGGPTKLMVQNCWKNTTVLPPLHCFFFGKCSDNFGGWWWLLLDFEKNLGGWWRLLLDSCIYSMCQSGTSLGWKLATRIYDQQK